MRVLGIETSCDETGIGLYDESAGLLAHTVHSQIDLHIDYGGVVPELASRDHTTRILPLIKATLAKGQCTLDELDGIAYTAGPGLVGALLVGAATGRSLAWALNIPALAVHHLEGHLLAPFLEPNTAMEFPFLALLVSGGHTQLIAVQGVGDYQVLGESLDDAVGEAFDKTAKLLGLGYPGGAALAQLAEQGDPTRFKFPRPMTDRPGVDFSFSGLKTAALNAFRREGYGARADIACAFQEAVVSTLLIKCKRALIATGFKCLVVSGGVSANVKLRQALHDLAQRLTVKVLFPRFEYCGDNGAMIAYAGCLRLSQGHYQALCFEAKPRWRITALDALSGRDKKQSPQ